MTEVIHPANNFIEKLLKFSLLFLFVPTGILVYATLDTDYASRFQWIRYLILFFRVYINQFKNAEYPS